MSKQKASYRSMMKGTAIFGGVQIFNILVSIIRGKLVAVLLGPSGMGISALLGSTINTVSQATGLGLSMGAIRSISMATAQEDERAFSRIVIIFRKLVVFTAIFGALVCFLGCIKLSSMVFGHYNYWWMFVFLGVMQFFTALGSGETTLLQGTQQLRSLAATSLIGSIIGLVICIPIYYFYGEDGIAPSMTILALCTYLSNKYFSRSIKVQPISVSLKEILEKGRGMLGLGIVLTLASLLGSLTTFLINYSIRKHGGLADVGLFQAASSITTQYVGFLFSAMSVDYFPRLSAVSDDNKKVSELVNQQAELMTLIASPLIILIFCSSEILIKVLLTESFISTVPLVKLLALSLFMKAASYAFGYISFSKGDRKTFFWLEGVYGNIVTLLLSAVSYFFWGLIGLGIAAVASYTLYIIVVVIIAKYRYDVTFSKEFMRVFIIMGALCISSYFLSTMIISPTLNLSLVSLMFIIGSCVSLREVDRRVGLKGIISEKFSVKQ